MNINKITGGFRTNTISKYILRNKSEWGYIYDSKLCVYVPSEIKNSKEIVIPDKVEHKTNDYTPNHSNSKIIKESDKIDFSKKGFPWE